MSPLSLQAAEVEVTNLDGETFSGELSRLDNEQLVLNRDDAAKVVSLDRIMKVTWPDQSVNEEAARSASQEILLTNGSRFLGKHAVSDGENVTFESLSLGRISIPMNQVKAIRMKPLDGKDITSQWKTMIEETNGDDRLVVLKEGELDHLEGVVTEYDGENVKFLFDGNEIPVRLEKVFGLVHPREMQANPDARCSIRTTSGELMYASRVSSDQDRFLVQLGPADKIGLPRSQVVEFDYSLGRVVYLSDLEPEGTEYTPFFDTIWEMQRDRTVDGSPLTIGRKQYSKGLWIHSKTRLTYRLAGEFSRLKALMGIDAAVASQGHGNVVVTFAADDEELLKREVAAGDGAIPVDLSLSGKRFLTITVDFGKGLDIGDHLDLVDARLIK